MKLLFLFLFSLFSLESFGASCCVSNTGLPNLMIFPSNWQQTFSVGQTRVIGEANSKGQSTFRNPNNKETTQQARLDLSYGWNFRYQTGISAKYQERNREFSGSENNSSGWSDIGLSHAYMPKGFDRLYVFQTVNIPTARRSIYDSPATAQGSGTYQTGLGVLKINNFVWGDILMATEVHRSFARTFKNGSNETEVGAANGGSVTVGGGWVPWKSKGRLGLNLTPRIEGSKIVTTNGSETKSKQSLVWDTSFNGSYNLNAEYALGMSYLDQTLLGPASNTILSRTITFIFQSRF